MNNFREVNDDILKDWLEFREDKIFTTNSAKDKESYLYFDELSDNILANVSEENKKYAQEQLDQLYDNFIDYLEYWNEKYYRNGFCDGVVIINNTLNS
ncbi:MAG: hypothetical protein HFJ29_00800 [Clostridia bacterium]|nr:hypothetical protein [Clostridia bacterium]MCI9247189.1 hypothetical protein [Clostridia bacterium]